MATLDEILTGEEAEEVLDAAGAEEPEEVKEEVETQEVEAKEEDDAEDAHEAETADAPEETAPPAEKHEVPIQALLAEREKRQELERQLAELKPKNEEKPDFWEDPESALQNLRGEFQQQLMSVRLEQSEVSARARHEDFEEKANAFGEMIQSSPELRQKMLNAPDPGEYVYKVASQYLKMKDFNGDIDALREQIRAEERVRLESEMKEKTSKLKDIPESLSNQQSKGGNRTSAAWEPPSLEDIVSNK